MAVDQKVLDAIQQMWHDWKESDDRRDSGLPHVYEGVTCHDNL